ncbi:MAG: HAD-IA family hydrolase [Acidimicrobiales bacterium]|nr:HAD-IA family hydrolase [Acidimicrobiales bacterium]
MHIEAVLFDFGGVISTSPFEAFTRYEQEHSLPDGFLRMVNSANPHANAWAKLERCEIDLESFDQIFAQESEALGHRVDGFEVLGLLSGDLRPEMVQVVHRCAEEMKVALLTNNVMGSMKDPQLSDLLSVFDVVVESSVVGFRKPELQFYEYACEQLAVPPHNAVFLDDLGINLKPARAMGMRTIKVTDPGVAIDELQSMVGFALR